MRKVAPVMVVLLLSFSPMLALGAPGGNGNGNGNAFGFGFGNGRGGAPLPLIGAGLPGLAVAGAAYFIFRRKRTDHGE